MSTVAVLVIVIAAGEARTPTTQALLAAATTALPPGTTLRVVPVPDPAEADVARIERELGAGAVVAVSWAPASAGARASLRLHVARGDRWTVRAIDFSPADRATERGRTLGFAIASMWPEYAAPGGGGAPPGPASAPERAGPASPPPPPPPRPAASTAVPEAPAAVAQPPPRAQPSPDGQVPAAVEKSAGSGAPAASQPLPPQGPFALGLGATGATALDGPAAGVGGSAEVVWRRTESVSLRAAVGLRVGPLPELPGDHWVGSLAAGAEWWPPVMAAGRWRFGTRADLLGLAHVVHRSAAAASPGPQPPGAAAAMPAETQTRLLPGVDASVRSALRLSAELDLSFGAGVEIGAGRTDLRVGEDRETLATLPVVCGIADIGLRLSF